MANGSQQILKNHAIILGMKELPNLDKLTSSDKNELIAILWKQNQLLTSKLEFLEERVKELEGQLKKNSRNSGKPPSSDGFKKPPKPKSLRKSKTTKRGREKGHPGNQLEMSPTPDVVLTHKVAECAHCGKGLIDSPADDYICKQVFDIPEIPIEVTEHRAELKTCQCCGGTTEAKFPEGLQAKTSYGPRIKSLMVYLSQYQLLPYHRVSELLKDLFGQSVSVGTIITANRHCSTGLIDVEKHIKAQLLKSDYLHCDETGLAIEGKNSWFHVASTQSLTFYGVHKKRGADALNHFDILTRYKGIAIHDHFNTYFQYNCSHALCNIHHLRELEFIYEHYEQKWARHMQNLLLAIKKQVEWHLARNLEIPEARKRSYERCYDEILLMGFWHPDNIPKGKRKKGGGFRKQHKAKNLLDRLNKKRYIVLRFMDAPHIPFDNNQAERDIRMVKVKQKISGTFRSESGAHNFARIRAFVSTMKKNQQDILQAIETVFVGKPLDLIPCP